MLLTIGVLVTGAVIGGDISPAYAKGYPTWDDVRAARNNEAAKQAEITRIEGLLRALEADVAAKTAAAEQAGYEFEEADAAFQEAAIKAADLQTQSDAASAVADESRLKAGQMVAQLARQGGDISASLLANAADADDLLSRLGYASRISMQSDGLYTRALQDMNTAQSLADQAEVARGIREELRAEAEQKQIAAQAAMDAATAALAEQQEFQVQLQEQLKVLKLERAATEADYAEGVAERERQRQAALAAAAAAAAGNTGSGGGPVSTKAPVNGWIWPVNGWITGHYGMRYHPILHVYRNHGGTDIGAPLGTPIYAARAGTVTYAARLGTYGNWVAIDHGNGISTGYAHIRDGGILVRVGQRVEVGQLIALVGSTGQSTGPHLHFEVRQNNVQTDAVVYLRNQGVPIG